MADPARAARLAQRIKVVVAQALGKRVKDPRVDAITITDARVTNDLQHATVYYTVFGDDQAQQGARAALEKAKGVLRSEVGRNITVRLTPTLEFVPDEIPVNADHLEELLRKAKARDAEVAALAQGATFAGEADPYKNLDGAEFGDDSDDIEDDEEDFAADEDGVENADEDEDADERR
ncbi:30S ribosome-binding factor RbfA [Arthrobacter sp. GCM10027362]|uniref:30S ribosome-binding factor RbfA n=1 Tax=Arthrobacter sp. GCM10027362 TaxID=3273379 RepID=UPI0036431648